MRTDELAKKLEEAGQALTVLEEHIDAVLLPPNPEVNSCKDQPDQPSESRLCSSLRGLGERIDRLTANIARLADRVNMPGDMRPQTENTAPALDPLLGSPQRV